MLDIFVFNPCTYCSVWSCWYVGPFKMCSSLDPEHPKPAPPPRWQLFEDCMTSFSILVEVDRNNPQLCGALVLAVHSFSDCIWLSFILAQVSYWRKFQEDSLRTRALSFTAHVFQPPPLSLHCDLCPQLREGNSWSILNIETELQRQNISGCDPDPDYWKSSLGDTWVQWGMRTINLEIDKNSHLRMGRWASHKVLT